MTAACPPNANWIRSMARAPHALQAECRGGAAGLVVHTWDEFQRLPSDSRVDVYMGYPGSDFDLPLLDSLVARGVRACLIPMAGVPPAIRDVFSMAKSVASAPVPLAPCVARWARVCLVPNRTHAPLAPCVGWRARTLN